MKKEEDGRTYEKSGVDYRKLDAFKQEAMAVGSRTDESIKMPGVKFAKESRGESVQLIEMPDCYLALVIETLGTKNIIADEIRRLKGWDFSHYVAQDTVAMIVNDIITSGAIPLNVNICLATGSSEWFNDDERYEQLIKGLVNSCYRNGCCYGGGETPVLQDIVCPNEAVLSGAAVGIIKPKENRISSKNIQEGDKIVLLESSGIHANGLTLAREIADNLSRGYLTEIDSGVSFGRALLEPTIIYAPVIKDCIDAGLKIHYASNITGHGWKKIMRAKEIWAYIIDEIPEPQGVFMFMQKQGNISDEEMYETFNMNAGFMVVVGEGDVSDIIHIADICGISAIEAGSVEASKKKKVVIDPLGIEYLEK